MFFQILHPVAVKYVIYAILDQSASRISLRGLVPSEHNRLTHLDATTLQCTSCFNPVQQVKSNLCTAVTILHRAYETFHASVNPFNLIAAQQVGVMELQEVAVPWVTVSTYLCGIMGWNHSEGIMFIGILLRSQFSSVINQITNMKCPPLVKERRGGRWSEAAIPFLRVPLWRGAPVLLWGRGSDGGERRPIRFD